LTHPDAIMRWEWTPRLLLWLALLAMPWLSIGCGNTRQRIATEQLLMSDAVDRAVAQIDFSPLAGKRVFFDTKYIVAIKGINFVNAEYVISSLRQQMMGAGCLLEDTAEKAEYVVEARCGALGTDGHEVIYGVPANSGIGEVSAIVPNTPRLPSIPEIALAKRDDYRGAAKIGVFAYHRETRQPVWQSGLATAKSDARDTWLFGAGPFQSGTIYDRTQFAGGDLEFPTLLTSSEDPDPFDSSSTQASYFEQVNFERQRILAERRKSRTRVAIEQLGQTPPPINFQEDSAGETWYNPPALEFPSLGGSGAALATRPATPTEAAEPATQPSVPQLASPSRPEAKPPTEGNLRPLPEVPDAPSGDPSTQVARPLDSPSSESNPSDATLPR
jgi:hypothetical protein